MVELNKMISLEVEIINKLGLHARASTKLTQTASKYVSEVWITRNARRVNAKSIMGVMMLAAAQGSFVTLEAKEPMNKPQLMLFPRLLQTTLVKVSNFS